MGKVGAGPGAAARARAAAAAARARFEFRGFPRTQVTGLCKLGKSGKVGEGWGKSGPI